MSPVPAGRILAHIFGLPSLRDVAIGRLKPARYTRAG